MTQTLMKLSEWIAFKTIVKKDVVRVLRIWPQTLLPPVITNVLYFLIFGTLIGARIGDINGLPFMQFITPGLIMMAVITNSYSNVVSSFFSTRFMQSIHEILVSPTPNYIILLGFCIGGVVRGLLVGILVAITALFFTHVQVQHLGLMLLMIILTSMLFSLAGFTNAIFARKFDDIAIVPTFVLTPLIYLGGIFYSVDMLPPFWQTVSYANPVLYMVNAFRYTLFGISDMPVFYAFSIVAVTTAILFAVNLRLLNSGKGIRT